jgi:hypothetical protein
MSRHRVAGLAFWLAACAAGGATAQVPDSLRAAGQPTVGPPVRRIATASAISREPMGSIVSVRGLPDGRVLVNDGRSRRLLLLDTMLVLERVVLDSVAEKESTYGNRQGSLMAHRGDSSIFIDPNSLALLVIDPSGAIARVRSVPRAQDVFSYASTSATFGLPAVDARGRLVYRMRARPAPPVRPPPRGVPWIPAEPDSAFIVGLDLDTRRLDTLGVIRTPKQEYTIRLSAGGMGISVFQNINPMPVTDEWAVLPDGAVAFVRAIDYRIEYLNADGTRSATPKIPFDWRPMPDSAKQRLVDSVRTAQSQSLRTSYVTSVIRWVNTYRRKYPPSFSAPDGYVPPNGFARDWTFPPGVTFPERYIYACAPGEEPTVTPARSADGRPAPAAPAAAAAAAPPPVITIDGALVSMGGGATLPGGGTPSCIPQPIPNLSRIPNPPTLREVSVVPPELLPDFRPPFTAGAVRADLDGNLWIRTNPARPPAGGPVYDVVNRAGLLVDRLQIPPNYELVGFGRGRVVYLALRDAEGPKVARVRLR